ncbi:transporter [Tabrizicola sp. TH137]|uniref:bile acid:sodium symporter family protein n=1 Tax=Tabrizicola sp. TH137 TaxID=2067452 RepID=UPI000C7A9C76|nr:bile acid:sodium symporter [Tabrizicola sp. TH137]PLL11606.1 transporter [Tabrizicola sp. TH137]
MVGPLEQAILALMIAVIMLGMGASLTPRDFTSALKRPYGLFIGLVSQYGFMPLIAFTLALTLPVSEPVKIGLLIMGCMPGGTTSNIFTYFSKGNLALSVLMTVNSTLFGVLLIPILLVIYATGLNVDIPAENIIVTLFLLLVPVAIGMALRRWNANVGALVELGGSALGIIFIVFLLVSWVPRNWGFLLGTPASVFFAAIALGLCGFLCGYGLSRLLRQTPRDARTVALETGIQNGPLAVALVVLTFAGSQQQEILAIPVLYSLFIVISSSLLTFWFRSIDARSQQTLPKSLL